MITCDAPSTHLDASVPQARRLGGEESVDRYGTSWLGRKVLVVGLGRSGQAVAELALRVGCRVRVTDASESPELFRCAESLKRQGVEQIELGAHTDAILEDCEAVLVSPGVPETSVPIRSALARGLPILSELDFAFRFCPAPLIAVTGTNGKSSVVTMLTQLLQAARRNALACGNLGVPLASVVPRLTPQTIAVVEVSSFQLLWCDAFHPTVAVLLNLGTNHLDRHHDRAGYVASKARLFQRQTPNDWAILNGADPEVVRLAEGLHGQRIWFGDNRTNGRRFRLSLRTVQALSPNRQAVLQVGRLLGLADPFIWQFIRRFRGLEHRLESVGTVRGAHFINDSKSTTPESLLYALHRVAGSVVLILGGRDKGLDFALLRPIVHDERIRGVVLIGESRERLRELWNGSPKVSEAQTLKEAIDRALTSADPGSHILFSPACASFDMFQNFEDRGQRFKQLVHRLNGAPTNETTP